MEVYIYADCKRHDETRDAYLSAEQIAVSDIDERAKRQKKKVHMTDSRLDTHRIKIADGDLVSKALSSLIHTY